MKKLIAIIALSKEIMSYHFSKNELGLYGMEYHMEGKKRMAKFVHSCRYFLATRDTIKLLTLSIICEFKGHKWEDHSYGNPESGCIHIECSRCGQGFHHTLY